MLIRRRAAIKKARRERSNKATKMVYKEPEDIPGIIHQWGQGIENGANKLFAKQEREQSKCLPPREQGLCVWAGADLITPEEELPACTRKVWQHPALVCIN